MITNAVYISHPQVNIDANVPVPKWGLSDIGRKRAETFAKRALIGPNTKFVSSGETKAIELAEILAHPATPDIDESMGENDRSSTGFLPSDAFEEMANSFFARPNESVQGWERAIDVQERIVTAVKHHLATHKTAETQVFCGHGAAGTLLKCFIDNRPISRSEDQPAGGGNVFVFDVDAVLAPKTLICDWTPMEDFNGI